MTASVTFALGFAMTATCAIAGEGHSGHGAISQHGARGLVRSVIQNASKYRSLGAAVQDGYVPVSGCVSGSNGAMGVHYGRMELIGDGQLDPATPEILVYEPTRWGSMRLVAVEYLTVKAAWEAQHGAGSVPILSGQHMFLMMEPNRYGLPTLFMLHVWAFKHNPSGMFAPYNPDASCEYYDPET